MFLRPEMGLVKFSVSKQWKAKSKEEKLSDQSRTGSLSGPTQALGAAAARFTSLLTPVAYFAFRNILFLPYD